MKSLKRLFCKAIGKKFSYGLFDGREIEDRRGIGVWDTQGKLFARLLASQKRLPTDMWKVRCNWRCPAAI